MKRRVRCFLESKQDTNTWNQAFLLPIDLAKHFRLHVIVHMAVGSDSGQQLLYLLESVESEKNAEWAQLFCGLSLHLYNWSFRSSVWKFRNILGMRNGNGKAIDSLSLSSWVRLFRPDWLGNIWNKQGELRTDKCRHHLLSRTGSDPPAPAFPPALDPVLQPSWWGFKLASEIC